MMHRVRSTATAVAVAVSSLLGLAEQTQAYQVDCAILLCLAGGWPESAPCAHARSVFIRRITPWPIEPPLQIWRCPMGASLDAPASVSPLERLYDIAFQNEPSANRPRASATLVPVRSEEQADIDVSGTAFDFIRSIRVFHIQFNQRRDRDGDCVTSDATRLGSYGAQGDYRWERSSVAYVPPASALPDTRRCSRVSYRSVFVDWRDHEGTYGFEEVRY